MGPAPSTPNSPPPRRYQEEAYTRNYPPPNRFEKVAYSPNYPPPRRYEEEACTKKCPPPRNYKEEAPIPNCPPPYRSEEEEPDNDSEIENQLHLFESGEQSDVTLICGGKHFPVHSHIVSARSDVFRAMFIDLNKDRMLGVTNVTPVTLEIVLRYMYSGEVPKLSVDATLRVYEAADMFLMESLRYICRNKVKKKIREDNAPNVLVFAEERDANDLKDIVVTYLAGRKGYLLSERWRRFCEKHPKLGNDVFLAFVRRLP